MAYYAGVKWPLGAVITCYGGGATQGRFGLPSLIDMAGDLQSPMQGHYGDLDQSIPLTEVEILGRKAAKHSPENEMYRYPNADHGFHCADRKQSHPESAAQSWERIVAFMKKHVGAS
jgi:carboxymethylenebutenolidase